MLGIVFTLVSIIGFLTPAEQRIASELRAIFEVDTVHNLVHLLFGLLSIAAAFTGYARRYNQVFGVAYTVLALLGLIPALYFPSDAFGNDNELFLGLMHINAGDHILHLVTGLAALYIGFCYERAGCSVLHPLFKR